MKSIILKGGLGNQLFQIAKFFDLYSKNKDLKIDINTGFYIDFKYKRKLEIKELKKVNLEILFIAIFPFYYSS